MSKAKILVVSSGRGADIAAILAEAGYEVFPRSIAIGTVAAIMRHRPALVILDVDMTLLSAQDICTSLRATPSIQSTRLLLRSDESETALRQLTETCNADGYIVRGLDPETLLRQVGEWLEPGRSKPRWSANNADPARPGSNRTAPTPGYALAACEEITFRTAVAQLELNVPIRFTDSGTEALRRVCSPDAPSLLMLGTSLTDLPYDVVHRTAVETEPSWRRRILVLVESGATSDRLRVDAPYWSLRDPVSALQRRVQQLETPSSSARGYPAKA